MATDEPPAGAPQREPTCRLFFALWPDNSMRQAMVEATRKAAGAGGGRAVPAENLHVTLAFLGSVPERQLPRLAEIARAAAKVGSAAAGSLALTFGQLEHWRAARLLCALPVEPPPRVVALARTLQQLLIDGGFAPDLKSSRSVGVDLTRPFRPHVTLVRKAYRPPGVLEMDPMIWSFVDFVLVESKTLPQGSVYTVLERFPVGH